MNAGFALGGVLVQAEMPGLDAVGRQSRRHLSHDEGVLVVVGHAPDHAPAHEPEGLEGLDGGDVEAAARGELLCRHAGSRQGADIAVVTAIAVGPLDVGVDGAVPGPGPDRGGAHGGLSRHLGGGRGAARRPPRARGRRARARHRARRGPARPGGAGVSARGPHVGPGPAHPGRCGGGGRGQRRGRRDQRAGPHPPSGAGAGTTVRASTRRLGGPGLESRQLPPRGAGAARAAGAADERGLGVPGVAPTGRGELSIAGALFEATLDHLQREEVLALLAQHPAQPFDVVLVELAVTRRGALGVDQSLALQEADLGDGHVGELLAQQGQDVADREVGPGAHDVPPGALIRPPPPGRRV